MQIKPAKTGLFRRTPPAIFTPIFGLFGLGLAWRRAVDGFGISPALGDFILGFVSLLYLFFIIAYAVKFIRRPGVFFEDSKTLPGRGGLAAMTLSAMLMAAAFVPYSAMIALIILLLAVLVHVAIVTVVLRILIAGPAEVRLVTPVWHLVFVGFIISPIAAVPLGLYSYSQVVFAITLVLALGIWAVSLKQLLKKAAPAPLRPVLAIHLAPASVLGYIAYLLGYSTIGFGLGLFAILILGWLLIRVRWLTSAGFSPLWGAFTFPLAAFSTLMQVMGAAGHGLADGEVFRILGGLALVAASLLIPFISWKIFKLWSKGVLAVKTNAAEA